jgi:hypothetical protein
MSYVSTNACIWLPFCYRAEKKGTRRKQLHITFLRFFSFSTINCKPRFRSLVSILRNTMIQIVPSTIHAYTETNCLFCW